MKNYFFTKNLNFKLIFGFSLQLFFIVEHQLELKEKGFNIISCGLGRDVSNSFIL